MRIAILLLSIPLGLLAQPATNLAAQFKASSIAQSHGSTVSTWADSSGNGNTATTAVGTPTLNLQAPSGNASVWFVDGSAASMTIPSGVATATQNSTICIVLERGNASQTAFVAAVLGPVHQFSFFLENADGQPLSSNGGADFTTLGGQPGGAVAQCMVSSASGQTAYREWGQQTNAALSSASVTGGFLGNYDGTGTFTFNGGLVEVLVYSAALNLTNIEAIFTYFHSTYGTASFGARKAANVVCAGDSITAGVGITIGQNWLNLTTTYGTVGANAVIKNFGVQGRTMATIASSTTSVVAEYNPRYPNNIAVVFAGTNDLAGCTNTSDCNTKEATLQTNTTSWVTAMHATGYKVLATTMLSRTGQVAAFDVARLAFNTWLRTLVNSGADAVADPGGDAFLGVLPQQGGWFVDGTHPTNAGDARIASLYMGPAIASLITVPVVPTAINPL